MSSASRVLVWSAAAAAAVVVGLSTLPQPRAAEPAKGDDSKWLYAEPTKPVKATPYVLKVPAGIDAPPIPLYNPLTVEKVELGKQLYFDKRLSVDNTVACATCHAPELGWTDGKAFSDGVKGGKTGRSAPTVINSAYYKLQFWDGRAETLEDQALGPIQSPVEMGENLVNLAQKLNKIAGYRKQFETVFGTEHVTADGIAKAIAAFERTVISADSAFDKWLADPEGNAGAISESAKRGFQLFRGKARCSNCHAGSNFSDNLFHNIGVGFANWDKLTADQRAKVLQNHGGRHQVTPVGRKTVAEIGAYKTPGLRDVSKTAPYMHDGSEKTLEDVITYYDNGGLRNPWSDPQLLEPGKTKLGLTDQEKKDLVEFLKALDGAPIKVEAPKLPE